MKVLLPLILLLSCSAVAEIYKWTDESGRVHYSDTASKDRPVEKIKIRVNSYEHVSYEGLAGSAAVADDKVVMYSTSRCGYCKKARRYFIANNIPYEERNIEKSRRAKREYDSMNGSGVPIILVGTKRMNGFTIAGFNQLYK